MRILLLLFLLLVAQGRGDLYAACQERAFCREAFRRESSGSMPPRDIFEQEVQGYLSGPKMQALGLAPSSEGDATDTMIARIVLGRLVLTESRCPPNTYWRYDEGAQKGECHCFVDRDCSTAATLVCTDTSPPILMALAVLTLVILGIDLLMHLIMFAVHHRRQLKRHQQDE